MRIKIALPFALAALSVTAEANDIAVIPPVTQTAQMSFEDASFAIENAILNAGLVIESQSHVGDMLARTKEDVGGTLDIYTDAIVFNFCSARVSRQVMEADPMNIQHCPYSIFAYETPDAPGQIVVGHRAFDGSMAPVNDLLQGIVADALMLD